MQICRHSYHCWFMFIYFSFFSSFFFSFSPGWDLSAIGAGVELVAKGQHVAEDGRQRVALPQCLDRHLHAPHLGLHVKQLLGESVAEDPALQPRGKAVDPT